MKTFRLIGLAIAAIFMSVSLSACSSDDDDDNFDPAKEIVGVWETYKIEANDYDGNLLTFTSPKDLDNILCYLGFKFDADGTFYLGYLNNDKIYYREYDETYSVSETQISLFDHGSYDRYNIKWVSKKEIVIENLWNECYDEAKYYIKKVQ